MAKQKDPSGDDPAYAEAEKALGPVKYGAGGAVSRSGKGSAAPVHLTPEQEREAEMLGKQDAAKELERRGLKPPPVVETSMSADFSKVHKPAGVTPAPPEPEMPKLLATGEKQTIRETGMNPVTGQIVDPDRYARWVAAHDGQPLPGLPVMESPTGWWYVKPKLPAPLPCPQERIQAPTEHDARKAYCVQYGMNPASPCEWDIKPAPKPEAS